MKLSKFGVIFSLITLITIFFYGCSSSEKSQSADSTSDDDKEVIVLKASSQAPPTSPYSKGFDALLDEIEEASDGLIEFERYYSESLAKADNNVTALSSGIADIAAFMPSYTPGNTPLANIVSNPAIWTDSWVGSKAINELYRTHPEMQEELENQNIKWIGQFAFPSYHVITTKDVKSIEDLKGLKLIATGQMAILAEELGATVVGMPITEAYDAMQRGIIDGAIYGYTSSLTYGLEEAAESVWEIPLGAVGGIIGMNLDVWNELPEDIQNKIEEISANEHPELYHQIYQIDGDGEAIEKFKEQGIKINKASEDDIAKLKNIAEETVWKQWIEEQESNGLPGEKLMEDFLNFVDKYEQENLFEN